MFRIRKFVDCSVKFFPINFNCLEARNKYQKNRALMHSHNTDAGMFITSQHKVKRNPKLLFQIHFEKAPMTQTIFKNIQRTL